MLDMDTKRPESTVDSVRQQRRPGRTGATVTLAGETHRAEARSRAVALKSVPDVGEPNIPGEIIPLQKLSAMCVKSEIIFNHNVSLDQVALRINLLQR